MQDDDDYKVGFKRPPKHSQFKKGQCANPNGRAGKKKPEAPIEAPTEAEILAKLDAETVEYQGKLITKLEAELRVAQAKSLKGDIRATQMLDAKRQKARAKAASTQQTGGVLVVPGTMPLEQWSAAAAIQQAKFRESDPEAMERAWFKDQATEKDPE